MIRARRELADLSLSDPHPTPTPNPYRTGLSFSHPHPTPTPHQADLSFSYLFPEEHAALRSSIDARAAQHTDALDGAKRRIAEMVEADEWLQARSLVLIE